MIIVSLLATINSLVEEIMKNENSDNISGVDEYYPETVKADGIDYYSGRLVSRTDGSGFVTAINDVAAGAGSVKASELFNINGQRISSNQKGLVIERQTFEDGSVKVIKKLNK